MAFSKEHVDEVKARADIVAVVGERVHLRPSGQDWVGLCPFHGEKTPSFRVSPAYRTYHCFGCGAGGSVIDFVMASENLSFPEAVRSLADRFGVTLPAERGRQDGGDRSREVLERAEGYYQGLLAKRPEAEPARRYLAERGFDETDWEAFGLGWALDQWQGFLNHGLSEGFGHDDLLASGLVRKSESGRMFDMLRKRVVFPIRDERGRAIAFGGRVLSGEDGPKYLNTPETRHYRKSRVLFGLSQGLDTIRRSRRALLVEGYLDVMRLHQRGFPEAVATCGTALTEEHLKLLDRYTERVVLVFDGDDAGVKAALRSAPLFLNSGLEARVVLLPDRMDPDDFLRTRPPEDFAALLDEATPLLEFLVFHLDRQHGRSVQGRQQTLEALAPVLSEVRTPAARDLTVRYVADLIDVAPDAVLSLVRPSGRGAAPDAGSAPVNLVQREARHQRRVLRLLLEHQGLLPAARDLLRPEHLSEPALRSLFERLLRFSDDEFAQMRAEELMEWYPELAPSIRALLMDEPHFSTAVGDPQRQLEAEVLALKESLKDELFRKFKSLAGTDEEELALRRYLKLRDELVATKAGFRVTHKPRPEVSLRAPRPSAEPSDAEPRT